MIFFNRSNIRKITYLVSALVILSFISSFSLSSSSSASPLKAETKSTSDFTSCVDRNKDGAVIVLMDESDSVYRSDSKNNRLQGVQIFIDELFDLASDHQAEIKVRLAGMGASYTVRSSGENNWETLKKGSDEAVSSLKASATTAWNGKSGTGYGNKKGTDIWDALDNAKLDLNPVKSECKLLLFFKDGEDWQFYARDGSDVKLPDAQEAREEEDFREADKIAAEDICRPLGLADSLRSADIYSVVAALGSGSIEKFSQLESLALGKGSDGEKCGSQPGKGDFIQVKDISSLQLNFASIFDKKSPVKKGSFTFKLSEGLTNIRIVSTAVTDSYKITPPSSCEGGNSQVIGMSSEENGTFGSAVNWKRTSYGSSTSGSQSALRVVVHHEQSSSDYSCWSGTWKIVASANTLTAIKFDANLKAVIKFNEGDGFNPVLFPGKSQKFKVILQRIDDPTVTLDPSEINNSLDYSAQAVLYSPDGERLDTLFDSGSGNGTLAKGDFFKTDHELTIDKDWGIGTYKIQLTLNASVIDSDLKLNPLQTETPVIVGNEILAPKVMPGVVALGTISGASPSKGVLTVTGGDEDACILFDQGEVKLSAAPRDASYKLSGECISIPAGETIEVPFEISPDSDSEDSSVGSVDGKFILQAQLMSSESTILPMAAVSFSGYQDAAPNDFARWALILIFMALSGFLSYLLLVALSKFVARFPKREQVANFHLQAIAFPVKVTRYEIKPSDSNLQAKLEDLDLPQWISVEKNRRSAMVSGYQLHAKSSGIKLASAGYAEAQGDFIGIGGPSVAGSPTNSRNAVFGLGLQNTWMLLFSPFELEGKVADDSFAANGQLILNIDANASLDKKMQLFSNAETAVSQKIENLVALANNQSQLAKSKKSSPNDSPKTKKQKSTSSGDKDSNKGPETDGPKPPSSSNDPWAF